MKKPTEKPIVELLNHMQKAIEIETKIERERNQEDAYLAGEDFLEQEITTAIQRTLDIRKAEYDRATKMSIPVFRTPIEPAPAAYLNGVMAGYGELVEIAIYREIWSGDGFAEQAAERATVGVRLEGSIGFSSIMPETSLIISHVRVRLEGRIEFSSCPSNLDEILGRRYCGFTGNVRKRTGEVIHVENHPVLVVSAEFSPSGGHILVEVPHIEHPAIFTLCDRCCYFMRGNPSICNAFHPVAGVSECPDFSA